MKYSGPNDTDEIVIVGSRYEELADVVCPLYDKRRPIETKEIPRILGSNRVIIVPKDNDYDANAVGVYTENERIIGDVQR